MVSMNILIIGSGFIGYNLALGLQESEYNVTIIDKKEIISPFKFYQRNIRQDNDDIFKDEKPDVVYYLINETTTNNMEVSVFLKFLAMASKAKIKKIIIVSSYDLSHESCATCNGTHKYNLQVMKPPIINQFSIELYLHYYQERYKMNFVSLRVSHIYGYREQNYWSHNLIHTIMTHEHNILDVHPHSFINLIFIGDVISALIYSLREDVSGIYNVVHHYVQYKQLIDIIQKQYEVHACFDESKPVIPKKHFTILNTLEHWSPIVSLNTGINVIKNQIRGIYGYQKD